MNIADYSIYKDLLEIVDDIGNRHYREFPGIINEVVIFDNVASVMIDGYETKIRENVYGVDYCANIIWQVPRVREEDKEGLWKLGRYTGMGKHGNQLYLFNSDGTDLLLDPNTGEILEKGWSK
ncbi:MAG: hypothetical protein JXM68_02470 [Sedimentisphaerales bacterium]|nr:hypothetical protein [Sedimentisphaerales bacterium]